MSPLGRPLPTMRERSNSNRRKLSEDSNTGSWLKAQCKNGKTCKRSTTKSKSSTDTGLSITETSTKSNTYAACLTQGVHDSMYCKCYYHVYTKSRKVDMSWNIGHWELGNELLAAISTRVLELLVEVVPEEHFSLFRSVFVFFFFFFLFLFLLCILLWLLDASVLAITFALTSALAFALTLSRHIANAVITI